jgi:LPS-assembly lipoprotein
MMAQRFTHHLIVSCLLLALSGCGFHLRESVTLPGFLQATAVQGVTEYSDLDLSLKRAFRQAGYPLTTAEQASSILVITRNRISRRVLSINSEGVANEYELKYMLRFKLLDNEKQVRMPEQTVTLYRSYRYDPDNVLAKAAEEERLKRTMTEMAVDQLIRRIRAKHSLPVSPATTPSTEKPSP